MSTTALTKHWEQMSCWVPCVAEVQLVLHAGKPQLNFVYRPVLLPACYAPKHEVDECTFLGTGEQLQLPGYGVEMAIKNMEYSALDDSKVRVKDDFMYSLPHSKYGQASTRLISHIMCKVNRESIRKRNQQYF